MSDSPDCRLDGDEATRSQHDEHDSVGPSWTRATSSSTLPLGLVGAQAGEARIRWVAERAGLHHFRKAAQTPFNLVYDARR